jgi:serine protease inhibitor ecotin
LKFFFYNEEWQSAGQPLVQFQLTGFVDGAEPRVQRGESLDSVVSADQNGHFWYPLSLEETPLLRVVEGFDSELMQQSLDGAHPFVASWREQVSVHECRHQLYQYVFKDEERLSTVSQYPQTFQLDQYWPYPAALGMKRSGAKVKLKAQEAHLSWWLSINQGKAVEQAESMSHFPEMNTLWDKWRHYASDAELVQESSNVMFQCRFQHWGLVSLSRQKGDLIESHGWGLTHATPNDLSALSGLLVYCPDAMHEFLYTPLVLGKAKLTFENNMVLASASMSPLNVHWLRKFGAFRDHRSQGMLLLVSKKTRDNSINIKIITACRLSDYGA